jgi:hypothetical protein
LILPDETPEDAFQRYLNAIRDPQVRHRVELFGRELRRLLKLHSQNQAPRFYHYRNGTRFDNESGAKRRQGSQRQRAA